jgi:hypothetical protein
VWHANDKTDVSEALASQAAVECRRERTDPDSDAEDETDLGWVVCVVQKR